ncbi:hypothetical protein BBJ28_00009249 [Nothophytophthora sp. Chile5]|nr:hypothetical protein BBJ28_00009249 [Nothophytophthora sp. Chile5]
MTDAQTDELSVLVRHVPQIVVSRFVAKPEPLRGPESASFLAAVALFDISGFSSLGSRLSEDEHRQHAKSGSARSVVLAAACSPAAADHAVGSKPPPLANSNNSGGSNSSLQASEPKTKSRMSLPSLGGVFDSRSGSSMSIASRLDSATTRSPGKPDGREGSGEEGEDVGPGGSMRRRQSAAQHSPGRMSFTHGAKPTAVPQGTAVEALTTTLNKSLEPVIDVILKHGGDIIKFAGDALIVLWETEATRGASTPAGELVYRAVCCALEALQALEAAFVANNEHLSVLLGMHVGIGVSQMTGNHVGGVLNRWEFYLSGDANRQMSFAEANAQTGQLALSPEAYAALEAEFQATRGHLVSAELHVTPHKSGNCIVHGVREGPALETPRALASPPTATTDLIPFLRNYVPGTIVSHLEKGLALTSCRLNITVAFVKLDGVVEMPDPQLQLQTIHRAMCSIQECAYKAQGTLRQFVIDDKGAIAIIALGLPPFYHENNGTFLPLQPLRLLPIDTDAQLPRIVQR